VARLSGSRSSKRRSDPRRSASSEAVNIQGVAPKSSTSASTGISTFEADGAVISMISTGATPDPAERAALIHGAAADEHLLNP